MSSLIELYRQMLATVRMKATEDGFISKQSSAATSNPVVTKNKRWVLPVPEQLAGGNPDPKWEARVAFHPLYENTARGESEVVAEYRKNINYHLNGVAGLLAHQLLLLATSATEQADLSPEQSEFLDEVKDADEETVNKFIQLMEKMDGDKGIVHIYVQRGGLYKGRKHSRVATVFFPLYEELAKSEDKIYGIKLRKKQKDKEVLMALMRYIFDKIDEKGAYSYGSESLIAPTIDALLHAVYQLATPINDLVELFRKKLEDPESLEINCDWIMALDNLGAMRAEIYSLTQLPGNEGSVAKGDPSVQARMDQGTTVATVPGFAPAAPAPAPVAAPAPAVAPGFTLPQGAVVTAPAVASGGFTGNPTGAPREFADMLRSNPQLAAMVGAVAMPAVMAPAVPMTRGGYALHNTPQGQGMLGGGWGQPANAWGAAPVVSTGWGNTNPGWGNPGGWGNTGGRI